MIEFVFIVVGQQCMGLDPSIAFHVPIHLCYRCYPDLEWLNLAFSDLSAIFFHIKNP